MKQRKAFTYHVDHFMTSKEVGEALLARAKANFDLSMCVSSGAPEEQLREAARKLVNLPSDPYTIAGEFFLLMHKLAKTEKTIGVETDEFEKIT